MWLAVAVSIATFMELLDTSIANVSLPHIAGSLGASQDEATWVLTSYLVANGVVLPLSGWLSTLIGRKRFYMACVAIFTIASMRSASLGVSPETGSRVMSLTEKIPYCISGSSGSFSPYLCKRI